jgi:hypothetical protein
MRPTKSSGTSDLRTGRNRWEQPGSNKRRVKGKTVRLSKIAEHLGRTEQGLRERDFRLHQEGARTGSNEQLFALFFVLSTACSRARRTQQYNSNRIEAYGTWRSRHIPRCRSLGFQPPLILIIADQSTTISASSRLNKARLIRRRRVTAELLA